MDVFARRALQRRCRKRARYRGSTRLLCGVDHLCYRQHNIHFNMGFSDGLGYHAPWKTAASKNCLPCVLLLFCNSFQYSRTHSVGVISISRVLQFLSVQLSGLRFSSFGSISKDIMVISLIKPEYRNLLYLTSQFSFSSMHCDQAVYWPNSDVSGISFDSKSNTSLIVENWELLVLKLSLMTKTKKYAGQSMAMKD